MDEKESCIIKPFVCIVESFDGKKTPCRVFADTPKHAREQLIKQFPRCYISPAIPLRDFNLANYIKEEQGDA